VRRVAGHALFYYAALEALEPQGEEASLRTLLKIIDFHHSSPLWDDALFLAADTLARLGFRGDETRLLEESLLPNPARGIDAMHDGFAQRVRLRLAQRYLAQGRYEEALYQLDLVVNKGSGLKWKDDALWLAARVFAKAGDIPRSCSTIRALLESCPWSKYVQAARKMVHCAP
jgi:tetratricopeptide (TPR) repeat protein